MGQLGQQGAVLEEKRAIQQGSRVGPNLHICISGARVNNCALRLTGFSQYNYQALLLLNYDFFQSFTPKRLGVPRV
jgi:hypothetical protein